MNATTPALLAAAAGVAVGHAILPDHWLPLAVIGRAQRYPLAKVARLSLLAGVAHVLLSIALGGVIIAVGLQFRSAVQGAQDAIIGCLLIATGLGFVLLELTGHGHRHRGHDHQHGSHGHGRGSHDDDLHGNATKDARADGHALERDRGHELAYHHTPGERGLAAVMVPFGAAASPDVTILPVFLAAATVGTGTAVASLAIFAAVTIATIVGLTLAAARGTRRIGGRWLDARGNLVTAVVLVVIGALVLTGAV